MTSNSAVPSEIVVPSLTRAVLEAVAVERERQNRIWDRRPGTWCLADSKKLSLLVEELGEVGRCLNDDEGDARLYEELVQLAALCVAWGETIVEVKP